MNLSREKKFKIALSVAGISKAKYARSLGVTPVAIHRFVKGQSVSKKYYLIIDRFIEEQLSKLYLITNDTGCKDAA